MDRFAQFPAPDRRDIIQERAIPMHVNFVLDGHTTKERSVIPESSTPIIQSRRLELVIPGSEIARPMAEYAKQNREHHVCSGPARSQEYFTEDFWTAGLAARRRRFLDGVSAEFLLFERDDTLRQRVVGEVNLTGIVHGVFRACYLGYNLDVEYVGKGLMQEALRHALCYAFAELRLHRVMANYMPSNARSASLLKRLGFQVEGYAPDYLLLNGVWQDHILTALRSNQFTRPE